MLYENDLMEADKQNVLQRKDGTMSKNEDFPSNFKILAMNKKCMKKFQEEEAFQRMNFLYQAAAILLLKSPNNFDIATHYGTIMSGISKKSVLRMDISLKRSVCKGCSIQLIPGMTAKVRIKKKPSPCVLWTCSICNTSRRYHNKRRHLTWTERPESVVCE